MRCLAPRIVRAVIAVALMTPVVAAQTNSTAPRSAARPALPRTPEGTPDLQGVWDFRTATPLERPRDLGDKRFFSAAEAAEFERRAAERIGNTVAVHPPDWLDYGMKVLTDMRTSLIDDPPDGRIPALTAEARARQVARAAERRPAADGPEDRNLGERCLVFSAGPPILPGPYNNNLRIVQTRQAVVMETEMIHDARIVPVDGRPHLSESIRPWLGDSRAHWEADTLVVETTNFSERTPFRGSDTNLRLVERLSLIDADTLKYEFTVNDPTVFTRPWTVSYPMTRSAGDMYEYACHEGNYGLLDTLKGARFEERSGTAAGKR
jgi:hypothetical protein